VPPTTSVQTFINALRSKQTKITLALDALMKGKARALTDDEMHQLEAERAFDLPHAATWPLSLYITMGMSASEIAHLESWPSSQRELVRKAVVDAIKTSTQVRFFWDLGDGTESQTDVQNMPGLGYVVTFWTPRTNIKGPDGAGEITIGI